MVTGKSEAECRARRDALVQELREGTARAQRPKTIAEYADWWCGEVLPLEDLSAGTRTQYRQVLTNYVIPHLGKKRLSGRGAITPADVRAMLTQLASQPHASGRGVQRVGYGPNTLRLARVVLGRMLQTAVRDGDVMRNVAHIAEGPRRGEPVGRALTAAELGALLGGVSGRRIEPLVTLHATTGLRSGELLGLRWSDVDLERRVLRVEQALKTLGGLSVGATKTRRSRRSVPLTSDTVAVLRLMRTRQLEDRLAAGPDWVTQWDGLLFRQPDGRPWRQDTYRKALQREAVTAGLGHIRPHDLRHTYATLLLSEGVALQYVAEILGDSVATITEVYSHVIRVKDEAAVALMNVMERARSAASPGP